MTNTDQRGLMEMLMDDPTLIGWVPPPGRVIVTRDYKEVEWDAEGLLKHDDPQGTIFTRNVASCYVLFGINRERDVALGHYYGSTRISEAETRMNNLLRRKWLDPAEFDFLLIPGPACYHRTECDDTAITYNVQFSRKKGLKIE